MKKEICEVQVGTVPRPDGRTAAVICGNPLPCPDHIPTCPARLRIHDYDPNKPCGKTMPCPDHPNLPTIQ